MRKASTAIFLALVAYVSFMGAAIAGNAVTPEDGSILDYLKPAYDAIVHGQWWLGASLSLMLAVTAAKRYLPGKAGQWVNGEYGQPLTVLLLSFGGAVATALGAGQAVMSLALAWTALKVAVGAAGGYTLLKKLLAPVLTKLGSKAPTWMKPVFDLLLWVFSKKTTTEVAEDAGTKAVADNPGTGAPKNNITEI